ncbi:MAG TPA: hypothetical protein DCG75_02655 [Bacteroidales bacterium]|nr:hypothetical protein [Bacteroidales bacterium]
MEVCYIWVDKFRNFDNAGFNFSSSVKFFYDKNQNLITKEELTPLPNNFFGSKIKEVTGIIGQNSTGKSNVLELICKIVKGGRNNVKGEFILITKNMEGVYKCFFSTKDNRIPQSNFQIWNEDYEGSLNPLKVIFFSNTFDERKQIFHKDVSDISLNNIFPKQYNSRRKGITSFEKQINFINSDLFNHLEIEHPNKVLITSKLWASRLNSFQDFKIIGEDVLKLQDFRKFYKARLNDLKSDQNRFAYLIGFIFFIELLEFSKNKNIQQNQNKLTDLLYGFRKLKTEEIANEIIIINNRLIREIQEQLTKTDPKTEKDIFFITDKLNETNQFINDLRYNISEIDIEYDTEGWGNRGIEYYSFSYNKKNSAFFKKFVNLFSSSKFIEANWLGISSGHKAYLNLFSLIFHELKFKKQSANLLLCIDEGDLYLHPKWQIEFFEKLIKILPLIFSESIQLILSSHSPFLVSDLPRQNLIILNNNRELTFVENRKFENNTFGGNIYDLYEEPFFLGKQRMSKFASSKINYAMERLESKSLTKYKRKEIERIIDLVGDEVIKFYMENLLRNMKNND